MNNQSDDERRTTARRSPKSLWKMLGASFLSGLGGGTPIARHPDERVAATAQRWGAIGGAFMSIALGIDLVVRIFFLKQDYKLFWDVSLIWMVNLFLVSIGQIQSGVQPICAGGKPSWRNSGLMILLLALEIPAILWVMGMVHSLKAFFGEALLVAASAFVMLMIMRGIYGKWERGSLGPGAGGGDAE